MKTRTLQSSIWLVNLILISLTFTLFCIISLYYYYAYAFNSVVKIEFIDLGIPSGAPMWLINMKTVIMLLSNVVALFVFWKIRKLLFVIREQGPFVHASIDRLKIISRWIILLILLNLFSAFVFDLFMGNFQIVLNSATLIVLFLLSIVYIVLEILKYGSVMLEEQKLTI